MPVSHLGLTVSHISSATSFYLTTLEPLGYRYIGHSRDSVGLGVDNADFFLTQQPSRVPVSPTHIAFAADSRLVVRNCYAAALRSGAYPSSAPSYRDRNCNVFNAAVEDLDGNVVEFVFTEPTVADDDEHAIEAPEHSRVLSWRKGIKGMSNQEDPWDCRSRSSGTDSAVKPFPGLQPARSMYARSSSAAPLRETGRTRTLPARSASNSEFPNKAFFGTLLGATAGAAVAWAFMKAEARNARDEQSFSDAARSQPRRYSLDGAVSRRSSVAGSQLPLRDREYSTTEKTSVSRKYPPLSLARSRPAIDSRTYYDDNEVHAAVSRYTASRRPSVPRRTRTVDAHEYRPVFADEDRPEAGVRRSYTLPADDTIPEGSASSGQIAPTSRSRRSTVDGRTSRRHDSGVSLRSRASHDSWDSHRTKSHGSHQSSNGTVKPGRRSVQEQLTDIGSSARPKPTHSAAMGEPRVRDAARASTYVTAAQDPWLAEGVGPRPVLDESDDSDGLGDTCTVVPDDSISCVGISRPQPAARTSRQLSSKHGRSDSIPTARPVETKLGRRYSAATLPLRPRDDGKGYSGKKRSVLTYA
ncbi:hypothetical protein BAUCODRAFT_21722 [Baudoinia panamericana UAMH 10762]|uniref:VOC domain-containing protein n=1 Tax=Baudoinia panamericana (strain UAMH 10762) TaxID=717646 RepID=M2N7J4_BAUPA|nr:uncharacterized protein BAUCODRAFT_21722 [Baudoinia panamericana UAMH 10762]EMD00059.1 hypothetical protein BAUCODRAFT_21722 [Baudoinia panamericana UAMH 10762]